MKLCVFVSWYRLKDGIITFFLAVPSLVISERYWLSENSSWRPPGRFHRGTCTWKIYRAFVNYQWGLWWPTIIDWLSQLHNAHLSLRIVLPKVMVPHLEDDRLFHHIIVRDLKICWCDVLSVIISSNQWITDMDTNHKAEFVIETWVQVVFHHLKELPWFQEIC